LAILWKQMANLQTATEVAAARFSATLKRAPRCGRDPATHHQRFA
jgi:hypothetical protein